MEGKALRLSAPRRFIGDLMALSMAVPRVTVQRRMNVALLLELRRERQRPRWLTLFVKGYGLLALETPEFRRAYVKLPWPHLYEYSMSVASVAHEREVDGEKAVLLSRIKEPEAQPLIELEGMIKMAQEYPIDEMPDFRRALRFAALPALVRRPIMRLGLNLGRQRPNYFGTFSVSVYASLGAESFNPLSPLTTHLNYGPIGDDGTVDVRILYDHRVMDGAVVARALARYEAILNGPVADELRLVSPRKPPAR